MNENDDVETLSAKAFLTMCEVYAQGPETPPLDWNKHAQVVNEAIGREMFAWALENMPGVSISGYSDAMQRALIAVERLADTGVTEHAAMN